MPRQFPVFLYLTFITITACSESAGFHPAAPRVLPNQVRLPGLSTVRVGERFNSRGFVRLIPRDSAFPAFIVSSPVYLPALGPQDSLEKTWVTMSQDKVRCVLMQRRQSYREALDSLKLLLGEAKPVWSDSSSTLIQTVWDDGYVTWRVGGHWYPGAYPVVITVMAVDPVGRRFSNSTPEMC